MPKKVGIVRGGNELVVTEGVRDLADAVNSRHGIQYEQFMRADAIFGRTATGETQVFFGPCEPLTTAMLIPYDPNSNDPEVIAALCLAFKEGRKNG